MNKRENRSIRLKKPLPLVVDLDGTLICSDLLVESFFASISRGRVGIARMLPALLRGKARLKAAIAAAVDIDPAHLPYDRAVLDVINTARREGREVFLASASNEKYVATIAEHLGLFAGWFASDCDHNLSATAKAERLVKRFGKYGFEYVGNDATDLAVWRVAKRRAGIRLKPRVHHRLIKLDPTATIIKSRSQTSWMEWVRLLRVHQYSKNLLVFVPALTAHKFDAHTLLAGLGAFLSFSLCASAAYILNDLVDIEADRSHPTKHSRPLASGAIPFLGSILAIPALMFGAFALAAAVSLWLLGVLVGYFVLTTAYTFYLKRKMLVDTITLAMLYTARVIGGAVATSVVMSEWLLAFSMFIFMSLALIKRYVELTVRLDAALPNPTDRNYQIGDLDVVAALAAAAGFNAVTVFALYLSSETVHKQYKFPQLLWLVCPVLIYWISRALMMAHRRMMHDDPIVFALRDRRSLIAAGIIMLIMAAAA